MKGKDERKNGAQGETLTDGILLSDDELDEVAGGGNAKFGDSSKLLFPFMCMKCHCIPGSYPRGGSAVICPNCDSICLPIL